VTGSGDPPGTGQYEFGIDSDLNMQLFTASFAKFPKHIDVGLPPFLRIAKISIGEVVSFDDKLHDLLCPRDHVGSREEPQFPDKRVKADKL
jgi:hypothetical protein